MKTRYSLCFVLVLSILGCGGSDQTPVSKTDRSGPVGAEVIQADYLREAVTVLASDEMEGRGPGTNGDRRARNELARRLDHAGYQPAFG